jgi:hypothetical protein
VSQNAIEYVAEQEILAYEVKQVVMVRLSDTKFFISYVKVSDTKGYCIAGSVSGDTITMGAEVKYWDTASTYNTGSVYMTTDKIMISYANSTTNLQAVMASLSENTITIGTPVIVYTGSINPNTTAHLKHLASMSSTLAVISYYVSGTVLEAVTISLSGTTLTANTAGKATMSATDTMFATTTMITATRFITVFCELTTGYPLQCRIGNISGTTITAAGSVTSLSFGTAGTTTRYVSIIRYSANKFIAMALNDVNQANINARLYTINTTGDTVALTYNTYVGLSRIVGSYPSAFSTGTHFKLSMTLGGNASFSYRSYSGVYVYGMLELSNSIIQSSPMYYKIVSCTSAEQVEISSVYFLANINGFSGGNSNGYASYPSLTINNTSASDAFIDKTFKETSYVSGGSTKSYNIQLSLANCPIIVNPGNTLWGALRVTNSLGPGVGSSSENINGSQKFGNITVFGIKRSV